jgi:hypothetical protein
MCYHEIQLVSDFGFVQRMAVFESHAIVFPSLVLISLAILAGY